MIHLVFPDEFLERAAQVGLTRLRLLDGGDPKIDGVVLKALVDTYSAHIECDTEQEYDQVRKAVSLAFELGVPEGTIRLREPLE